MAEEKKSDPELRFIYFSDLFLAEKKTCTPPKVTGNFRAQGRDPCVAKNQKETNLKMGKQKVLHNL